MKVKILHLSDIHFKDRDIQQDLVVDSMTRVIEKTFIKENKPTALIITGDVTFSGKESEYKKASEFIENIVAKCEIKRENVFIIPGNHDVDRSKIKEGHIKWWYNFDDEKSLMEILTSDDSFPKIIEKISSYCTFSKQYINENSQIGKYGEYVCELTTGNPNPKKTKIKIVGLNSSLFCGYDGDDKQKLALGLDQVSFCESKLDTPQEVIISCVHHPFDSFHLCEKPTLNTLKRFSDIILSGHVHDASNSARRDGNQGETVFVSAGASYERRDLKNGFNVIEIDDEDLTGNVIYYKYMPDEHTWIIDKDINHETDGVFSFKVNKTAIKIDLEVVEINALPSKTEKYCLILDTSFEELNRNKVNLLIQHLKRYTDDVNVTVTKMEKGSVKIYFETRKTLPPESSPILNELFGNFDPEIKKVNEEDVDWKPGMAHKSVFHWKTFLKPEFHENIENPGATFTHSRADDLTLKDLYVAPNLKKMYVGDNFQSKVDKIVYSEEALKKKAGEAMKIIVYGTDASGKSTLARWWYEKYYQEGYIPILITPDSFKDIKKDRILKTVNSEFKKQYNDILDLDGNIKDFEKDRIIIIIDDFHQIRFSNAKFKANLIYNLNELFDNILLTGNTIMRFEKITTKNSLVRHILDDFDKFEIVEFGPRLRYDLIRKWNGIGGEQLETNELIRINNETESHVESIIGKNFVPSYPVYILTILQAREASSTQKPDFSLHGFYYELLINEALNHSIKNKGDISLYYNIITDYAYFLFKNKIRLEPVHTDGFILFYSNYCKEYNIDVNYRIVIDTLVNSKLFKENNGFISISYRYVYYFFVARYLAINISNGEIKDIIKSLCQRVYRDEFSNIVMFLTHLSKEQFIINELLENSKGLFSEYQPVQLNHDVDFINEMVRKLPEQIYKPINIDEAKEENLREKENLLSQENEFESTKDVYDYDINEDISALDIVSKLTKAMKTIEIVGQVTKKYWGELKANQKYELAEETYMLGLRSLGFYYGLLGKDVGMLVDYLKHIFRKKHLNENFSKDDVDRASRDFLFGLCVMASYGIVKNVSNAIGYEKLTGTFETILKNHNYTSVQLIDTSIKLDHNKKFPLKEIKLLKKETEKNYLSNIVLKNIVINYLYVFHTSVKEKQEICDLLGIKMAEQRMIDIMSVTKKETPNS